MLFQQTTAACSCLHHQFSISFVMELAAAPHFCCVCYFYATKNVYKRFHVVILFKFNFHYKHFFQLLSHRIFLFLFARLFLPSIHTTLEAKKKYIFFRTNKQLKMTTKDVGASEREWVHYVSYCYSFLFHLKRHRRRSRRCWQ